MKELIITIRDISVVAILMYLFKNGGVLIWWYKLNIDRKKVKKRKNFLRFEKDESYSATITSVYANNRDIIIRNETLGKKELKGKGLILTSRIDLKIDDAKAGKQKRVIKGSKK